MQGRIWFYNTVIDRTRSIDFDSKNAVSNWNFIVTLIGSLSVLSNNFTEETKPNYEDMKIDVRNSEWWKKMEKGISHAYISLKNYQRSRKLIGRKQFILHEKIVWWKKKWLKFIREIWSGNIYLCLIIFINNILPLICSRFKKAWFRQSVLTLIFQVLIIGNQFVLELKCTLSNKSRTYDAENRKLCQG